MMKKRDLLFTVGAAALITVFLTPTLKNLGIYAKIPNPNVVIFVIFPVITILGMLVAYFIGRIAAILWQIAKFGLVGVLNTVIDFGVLNFLITLTGIQAGLGIIPLNLTSFTLATVNSYFWSKYWVFEGSKKSKFIAFLVVSILGILLNTAVVFALTTFVPPPAHMSPTVWANAAKVTATFVSLIWNFLGYKLIVFKK
jgi:putative flippase GtrA